MTGVRFDRRSAEPFAPEAGDGGVDSGATIPHRVRRKTREKRQKAGIPAGWPASGSGGVWPSASPPPTLRTRIGSVPARWHIVSATGVVFFWAFHHERLHPTG